MIKKYFVLLHIVIMLISLSACKHEQTEDIYILFTNDVAGEVYGEIGYAGVKGYKDSLLNEHQYVCLVDAGDYFDGDFSSLDGGDAIVEIMNAVGYDVAAVGNQEFAVGIENLAANIDRSNFDYVSCNLKYLGSGKDPLSGINPYAIKKYGYTKIAFIGVTTPETLIEGKAARAAITQDGELLYSFYEGNEGHDLYEQVQKTVNKVKRKADYVIVLSHLGSNSVTEGFSSYDLIDHTSGIDAVIDAHSHTVINGEGVYNADGENVVLASTGEKLENLGVMILHTDHSITTELYPSVYDKDAAIDELISSLR